MKPIILIATAALLLPTFSKAATATFLPTGAGVWNDAANWSSGVIPNNDTPTVGTLWDVTIPIPASNSGNATIAISTSTSIRDLQFESAVLTQTTGSGDALGCSHYLLLNANLTTTGNVSLVFQNAPASGRLYIGGPGTWINRGTVNVPDSVPPSLGYLNNRLTVSADIDNYGSMMFSEFGEVYFERVSTDERSSYTGRSGSLISLSSYYLTNFDSLVLEQGATMSISAPSHVSRFGTFFGGGNGDMAFVAGIASLHGNVIANANSCFGLQFINGVDLSGTWTIMPNVDPYYNTFGEPSGLRSQSITISAPFVLNGGGRIMVGGLITSITDPVPALSISSGASITIAAGTTWQQAFDPQEITGGDIKVHGIYHLGYGGSIVLKSGGRIVVENGGRFKDFSLDDWGDNMTQCTIADGGELRIKSGGTINLHRPIVITGTGRFINEGNMSIGDCTNYTLSGGTSSGTITVPMCSSLSLVDFTLSGGAVENHGTLTISNTDFRDASYHGFAGSLFNASEDNSEIAMSTFMLDTGAALNVTQTGSGFIKEVTGAVGLHGSISVAPNSVLAVVGQGAVALSGNWVVAEGSVIDNQGYQGQTITAPLTVSGGNGEYSGFTGLKLGGDTTIAPGASLTIGAGTKWQLLGGDGSLSGGDAHVFGMFDVDGGPYSVKNGGRILIENGGILQTYDPLNFPFSVDSGGELRIETGGVLSGPVAVNGTGILVIEGALSVPAGASIAMTGGGTSSGTITVPVGSSLSLGNFTLAAGAVLNNSGTVSFDGAVTSANPLSVTGTIAGSGSLTISEMTITSGTLSPGNSPGTLTINGALSLTPATVLEFDLGTASDKVVVTGNGSKSVVLDGTLNITAGAGFGIGSYTLFDYAGLGAGAVDNGITFGTMPAGYQYYVEVNEGQRKVLLHVVNTLPSLPAWKLAQLGNVNAPDSGDPDGDGLSTLAEYGLGLLAGTPDISGRPHPSAFDFAEGRRMRLWVQRDPARNDVTVDVEAAPSLAGPWTIVASSALGAPFTGPGYVGGDSALPGLKTVEIRDVENMTGATERFLRVKVTH